MGLYPTGQRDPLFWTHPARDADFDADMSVHRVMATIAGLDFDVPGFVYRDSRDLTGFIDGTANPKDDAAREAALVPPTRRTPAAPSSLPSSGSTTWLALITSPSPIRSG